jgi:hypothetical protein
LIIVDLFDERPGCLAGLFQLLIISALFDWMQENFGFGRGCSCISVGCGFILLSLFACMICGVLTNTDWFSLFGR